MDGLPAHPERSALRPVLTTWSWRAFTIWSLVLVAASVAGAVATVQLAPADSGGDMFDSPMLVYSLAGITVLCGFAGGFVPAAAPYWGLMTAVPYLGAFLLQLTRPSIGASLAPVGFVLLLVGLAVPWAVGFAAGLVRKAGR